MQQERRQEIRGLLQILQQTAQIAENSALTENYTDGESRCISQFNKVLKRLVELNAIPDELFDPLQEDAGFSEISIACNHLAAYLSEGFGSFPDLKGMMTNILGKSFIENIEAEFKEGKIGELIRNSIPEFMTETALDDIHESFTVSSDSRLMLESDIGSIDLKTTDTDVVNVVVHRTARLKTDRHANTVLKDFQVDFIPREGELKINGHFKDGKTYRKNTTDRLNIHFVISVPKTFHAVYLKTKVGDIAVSDLNGAVQCQTNSGELLFQNITGPLFGNTGNGDLRLAKCKGDVRVETLRGNIDINENHGDIEATTSGGNIKCSDVDGRITCETSGGNIRLLRCKGGTKAETSGGNIDIENDGPVNARTFGGSISLNLSGQPKDDSTLEVSGGDITVSTMPTISAKVNAKCSGGEVISELPVTLDSQDERSSGQLHGVINHDGPLLKLRCVGGDIKLKSIILDDRDV